MNWLIVINYLIWNGNLDGNCKLASEYNNDKWYGILCIYIRVYYIFKTDRASLIVCKKS